MLRWYAKSFSTAAPFSILNDRRVCPMISLPTSHIIADREISLRRLGDDEKLLATLVGFFLEDAPVLMTQLGHAYDSCDLEMVAHRAHSLKGLSATFEAVSFMRLAAEIESLARAADQLHLKELLTQLNIEYDRLVSELRRFNS